MALLGGEGNSEGLRDYLFRNSELVYSGYGATDIEIGIAGETPISLAIRREARHNERLRKAIFGRDSRLTMVFQYNPLMHHIVVNEIRELMFTITRLNVLAPRIAYNIHDEGGIAKGSAPKINDTRTQMMTTTTKAINATIKMHRHKIAIKISLSKTSLNLSRGGRTVETPNATPSSRKSMVNP